MKAEKTAKNRAADRERIQMRRNDAAFCELEVCCNLCTTTQSVRGIRNACLLIQIAARRERRADPAVWESVRGQPAAKTQSVHVDDLFLLLVLFQNAAQSLRHRERRTAPQRCSLLRAGGTL